jgi:PAS domain S-box-containing protein
MSAMDSQPKPRVRALPDEKREQAFLKAFPGLLFEVDEAGCFIDARAGGGYQSVIPVASFIGKSVYEMLPPDGAAMVMKAFHEAIRTDAPQIFEFIWNPLPNNEKRWYEARICPVAKDRCFGIIRNISETRRQEEDLRRMQQALHQSPVSVLITDATGNIEYVNPRFTDISGYTSEEVLGQNPRLLKSGQTPPETYQSMHDSLAAGQEWHGEFINKRKNGEIYVERSSISVVRNAQGEVTHVVAVNEDVTAKKDAELKLQAAKQALEQVQARLEDSNTSLERKVAERTAEIEALVMYKDELIRHLGHDLKTPLTPILGLLPILLEGENSFERRKMVQLVMQNAEHIRRISENTLELTRLSGPGLVLANASIELRVLAHEALLRCKRFAQPKSVSYFNEVPSGLFGWVDRALLILVLDQLLDNACRYSLNKGRVWIGAEKSTGGVEMWVGDEGAGLSQDQGQRIFDEFYKGDPSRHGAGNVGLGLAICRRALEKHQGYIWAESAGLGQGTAIRFFLPEPNKITQPDIQ